LAAVEQVPPAPFSPLLGERLKLRRIELGDVGALHRLVNDWEVAKNLGPVPFPYPREAIEAWILATHASMAAGRAFHLLITGRDEDVPLGVVGMTLETPREGRIGYWVGRRFWGHGVAQEAAARLASWAFASLGVDRLRAYVVHDNPASMRVLERLGFRFERDDVREFLSRGGVHPVRWFTLDRAMLMKEAGHGAASEGAPATRIVLVAACALVDLEGRVLIARRPEGKALAGLWEFPGGKVAEGETPEVALIRELHEELGIDVAASCLAPFTFASHAYEAFHLLMPLFVCRRWKGVPQGREGQALAWVTPNRMREYPMPPADVPLIPLLRDLL